MNDEKENSTIDLSRYLEFSLAEENFAIPLLQVRELISIPETTPIPNAPSYFLGIMNLRGQVISVVDLRKKMKMEAKAADSETAVIIIEINGVHMGIVVDSINRVLNVGENDVQEIPEVESQMNAKFISGIFKHPDGLTIFVNLENMLGLQDIKTAESAA
jgi:purine-binding chemotaxis protein CheW